MWIGNGILIVYHHHELVLYVLSTLELRLYDSTICKSIESREAQQSRGSEMGRSADGAAGPRCRRPGVHSTPSEGNGAAATAVCASAAIVSPSSLQQQPELDTLSLAFFLPVFPTN